VDKKELLIKALEEERDRLPEYGLFGKNDSKDHNTAIKYLKTGEYKKSDLDKYDTLEIAVNNLEELYDTYL